MITWFEKPSLNQPVLLAAWPGMGNVAVTAVSFLKQHLGAKPLGEIDCVEFFAPTGASIKDQLIQPPIKAVNQFFYYQSPGDARDLILFLGSAQPIPHYEYEFAVVLLKAALEFDIQAVFTTGAAPSDMKFQDVPRVFAVPNQKELTHQIVEYSVHFMAEGNIAGLNGLLIAAAAEMNLPGLCLLGEIPFFTAQMDFPRASLNVLDVMAKLLKLKIDLLDLELYVSQKEREIEPLSEILNQNKNKRSRGSRSSAPLENAGVKPQSADTGIPNAVFSRVETLFKKAESDQSYKSKMQLKEELDKWGLFDEYLDRFLDLFKKNDDSGGVES